MARTTDLKKEQFWKTHIAQARHFDGSIKKYCQSQGLKVYNFNYWARRFAAKASESKSPTRSPFLPVKALASLSAIQKKALGMRKAINGLNVLVKEAGMGDDLMGPQF